MRKSTKALIIVAMISGGALVANKKKWFDLGETLDELHRKAQQYKNGDKLRT